MRLVDGMITSADGRAAWDLAPAADALDNLALVRSLMRRVKLLVEMRVFSSAHGFKVACVETR